MAKEEIEKLKEKVEKDPLSKLFVPLAEEYRKLGMVDEAISVLLRGLENQPNYMTARVALGKIYLEKNMLKEAKEEFKKVITAIPDNLFALKKIAEISAELGDIPEAIDAYNRILKLNPLDEEAKINLEELKSKSSEEKITEPLTKKPSEPPPPESPVKEEPEHFELEGFMPVSETSVNEEEFEKFKKDFYSKEILHEETPEIPQAEPVEKEDFLTGEELITDAGEIQEIEEVQEISEEDFFLESPEIETEASAIPSERTFEPGALSADSGIGETERLYERKEPDFSYPDRLIQQGNYAKAIEVYKKMLAEYPGDGRVIQRLEELKALLKILGKGNELVVEQLTNFLEAIKKRKDEFFKNS